VETGLYYNRFRYYNPEIGLYISQDPIRLASGQFNQYAYVTDSNLFVDVFGLSPFGPMPNGGWNYHNMPKIDGFQLHHIIPKSLAEGAKTHEIFKLSGYDIHNMKNTIYLPTDRQFHPIRSIHSGYNKLHAQYNADMRVQLDDLVSFGKENNRTKEQYHDAMQNLINDTRQDLRKDKIKLYCKG
jgi:hypothetical protein